MLRYPPHERLGSLVDQSLEPISVHTSAAETSRILATYNLVSVPVVDEKQRLVGVVTVDDILDYLLPEDWRSNPEEVERAAAATHPLTSNLPIIRPTESPASTRGRSDRHGAT